MDTIVINGVSCEIVEINGNRYVKKPAGGTGGGQTSFALELMGDVPVAPPASAPAEVSVMVPEADAKAIEDAVAKAEADAASHTA